jgi:hypothetical protein
MYLRKYWNNSLCILAGFEKSLDAQRLATYISYYIAVCFNDAVWPIAQVMGFIETHYGTQDQLWEINTPQVPS